VNQFADQLLQNADPSALFHLSVDKQRHEHGSNSTGSQVVTMRPLAVLLVMPQESQQVAQQTDVGVGQCQQHLAHSLTPPVRLTVQFWYKTMQYLASDLN
jgi:hypothetical protein